MATSTTEYRNILIVDDANLAAVHLADRFRALGAKVHVVKSCAAAANLVDYVKVDVVFIAFQQRNDGQLRLVLAEHGIPHITCASIQDMPRMADQLAQPQTALH